MHSCITVTKEGVKFTALQDAACDSLQTVIPCPSDFEVRHLLPFVPPFESSMESSVLITDVPQVEIPSLYCLCQVLN